MYEEDGTTLKVLENKKTLAESQPKLIVKQVLKYFLNSEQFLPLD